MPDRQLSQRFDWLLGQLFDPATGQPYHYAWRIQNVSSTIGMLADRYEAYGNPADLDRAERLADWLISGSQTPDGAYMNGHTDYTSVIYPAKSLLELADAEYAAGRRSRGRCYEASARRAVDHLVLMDGNFNTEREILYKILFDLRHDIIELKNMVAALGGTNSINATATQNDRMSSGTLVPVSQAYPTLPTPQGHYEKDIFDTAEFVDEPAETPTKEIVQREAIIKALRKHGGKRKDAARELFISERTLYRKIIELGIDE